MTKTVMKVPQFMPWVGQEEYQAIASCFEQNWITEGPKAEAFTNRLLELTGARYGVLAPNGTLAIYLALKSMGIAPESEVIVPNFTFIASANAVIMAGARPVFVEVNPRNFQIDLSGAERVLTPKTKAVMPVHIYGTVADMDAVCDFAKRHNLMIIEDAAQAIGVHFKGRHAGTFGETGTFSFFADKTITTAEGGFVTTNEEEIYHKLLYLRNQGRKDRGTFIHPELGYNFRMTDIQCAVGLVQLDKLETIKEKKARILELYENRLADIEHVRMFSPDPGAEWIPFRVGILCKNAQELMKFMTARGIEPRRFFYPLHRQPAFAVILKEAEQSGRNIGDDAFPNAVYAYEHGICLPTFVSLSEKQVAHVCGTIEEFYD